MKTNHDDVYYGCLARKMKIKIKEVSYKICYYFHDTIEALSSTLSFPTIKSIAIIESVLNKQILKHLHN